MFDAMDRLWEKSHSCSSDEYIDIFGIARSYYCKDMNDWDAYFPIYFKRLHFYSECKKSNQVSDELLLEGQKSYRAGKYRDALEKINRSLCFAELGSESESNGYANRAACFMQMKKYTNALFDIDLALKFKLPSRERLRLQSMRCECETSLKSSQPTDVYVPRLSTSPNFNFPCIANIIELRENEEFGRHIVAKCDIPAGEVVIVSDVFASATVSDTLTCCVCCNKTERNFIACANCPKAMFCIGSCTQRRKVHSLECGSIFHLISDTVMKLPTQTILMAIAMFPSVNVLMDFVDECVRNRKFPKKAKDLKSRYALFLQLTPVRVNKERIYWAYQVYTTLLDIKQVRDLFDTSKKRKFLMHLTIHHLAVIPKNAFRHERNDLGWMQTDYIYDVMSLINHSCSPNLRNSTTPDDIGYCVTIKNVKKGEQLFINYLGDSKKTHTERSESLNRTWNFECKCRKCEAEKSTESNHDDAMMQNGSSRMRGRAGMNEI